MTLYTSYYQTHAELFVEWMLLPVKYAGDDYADVILNAHEDYWQNHYTVLISDLIMEIS